MSRILGPDGELVVHDDGGMNPEIRPRAVEHGWDPKFFTAKKTEELQTYAKQRLQYFTEKDLKRYFQIAGAYHNFYAIHLAVRDVTIKNQTTVYQKKVEEIRALHEEIGVLKQALAKPPWWKFWKKTGGSY